MAWRVIAVWLMLASVAVAGTINSQPSLPGALLSTDAMPAGRVGAATAYKVTVGQIADYPPIARAIQGNYSGATLRADDVIASGPWVDIRSWMSSATLAAWQADKSTDVTEAFQTAIDSVPTGGAGEFGLPNDTYVTGPLTITNRKITFRSIGGVGGVGGYPIIQLKDGATDHHFTMSGTDSRLRLYGILLDGNKANQSFESRGIYCQAVDSYSTNSAIVSESIVRNYKGDGVHVGKHRNNLWIINRSYIIENDGHGVYGFGSIDSRIWQSDIGDSGLSNIYFDGDATASSAHLRIGLNDIYHPGLLGTADAHNVYLGTYVNSAYLLQNDYLKAPRYGIYVAANWASNPTVDIVGGRFSYNSNETENTYSDVFAGHAGVTLTATTHQGSLASGLPRVKWLVEVSDDVPSGSAIGVLNPTYSSSSYSTATHSTPNKVQWFGKDRVRFAQDRSMSFGQSAQTVSLIDSAGTAGAVQFQLQAGGRMYWGNGTDAADTSFERVAAGIYGSVASSFRLSNTATYQMKSPSGDTYYLWAADNGNWRTGNAAPSDRNNDGSALARNQTLTLASAGTISVPFNSYTYGQMSAFTLTPTSDTTLNASGGVKGATATLIVTTSGITSRVLTFGTNFVTTGTLETGTVSGKVFTISFACADGTSWVETSRTTAM